MEKLKIAVSKNQNGTISFEDFDVLTQLPVTDETYNGEEIIEIQAYEKILCDQPEIVSDYNLYKIITQNSSYPAAVKQLSPTELRAKCIDKPWNWITKDPYLSKALLEEAVVIDPQTGGLPEKSGDYTIDLAFGLCASGHYDTGSKEITITDTAIVFDPWE